MALTTAAADPRITAVIAVCPLTDGLAMWLEPTPPGTVLRMVARALRETITRRPVTIPVAGKPGDFAGLTAPEALPGFEHVTAGSAHGEEKTQDAHRLRRLPRAHPRDARRACGINRWKAQCLETGHAEFGGRLPGKRTEQSRHRAPGRLNHFARGRPAVAAPAGSPQVPPSAQYRWIGMPASTTRAAR
ncbi:MAG: hypothetical protein ACRDOC_12965 [Streptosporangiaceae bacterium]